MGWFISDNSGNPLGIIIWGFVSGLDFGIKLGEFTMVSQPIGLILVDWFVFYFSLRSSSILFLRSSSLVSSFFWSSSIFLLFF